MALGKDKTAVPLNANVPGDLRRDFDIAYATRGMKVQEAVADALRQFVATAKLQDHDRALLSEVIEMIQDKNGSYRAAVADTVQTWKAKPDQKVNAPILVVKASRRAGRQRE